MANENLEDEPKGVAGWLAVFVTILGLISPIRIMMSLLLEFGLPWQFDWDPTLTFGWTINVLAIGFSIYLAYQLYVQTSWRIVRFVILGLWVLGIGVPLAVWVFAFISTPDQMEGLLGDFLTDMFRGTIFSGVWTLYLLNSKRVRNTYAKSDGDIIAETFA